MDYPWSNMGHFSSFNIRHFHPCDPHWGWSHPSWCSNSNHPWIRPLNPQSPCGLLCSSTHRSDSPLLNHFFYARIVEDFAGWMPWNIWNISPLLLTQPHFNHFFTMSWYFKCFSLLDFWICFSTVSLAQSAVVPPLHTFSAATFTAWSHQ